MSSWCSTAEKTGMEGGSGGRAEGEEKGKTETETVCYWLVVVWCLCSIGCEWSPDIAVKIHLFVPHGEISLWCLRDKIIKKYR